MLRSVTLRALLLVGGFGLGGLKMLTKQRGERGSLVAGIRGGNSGEQTGGELFD